MFTETLTFKPFKSLTTMANKNQSLFDEAYQAGVEAMNSTTPTPILIGEAKSFLSDEIDHSRPTYVVSSGVCGFAWVNIKPGNSSFARWLVKNGIARKSYYGGVDYRISSGGQSMELKQAFATAFAKVLSENGIKAYADSRMD